MIQSVMSDYHIIYFCMMFINAQISFRMEIIEHTVIWQLHVTTKPHHIHILSANMVWLTTGILTWVKLETVCLPNILKLISWCIFIFLIVDFIAISIFVIFMLCQWQSGLRHSLTTMTWHDLQCRDPLSINIPSPHQCGKLALDCISSAWHLSMASPPVMPWSIHICRVQFENSFIHIPHKHPSVHMCSCAPIRCV